MLRTAILMMMFCMAVALFAKEITVSGSCEFIMTPDLSETEAVGKAVEQAKVDALAREFGTVVSSEMWNEVREDSSRLSNFSYHSGLSLVKGEWLRDIQSPEIVKSINESGDIVISVKVKGKAREIESLPLTLEAFVSLPGAHIPQKQFRHDTRFTVNFKSPADGYIAIYLGDEDGDVCRLLPFSQQQESSVRVEAMKDYEFFTSQEGFEEQYRFLTLKPREYNMLYIIFGRNQFPRPLEVYEADRNLRILKKGEFLDWLARFRSFDSTVQVQTVPVEILGEQ